MSSVDNRIVQMEFVNAKFEKGVEGTIKSLEGLKQGLDLSAASAALKNLQVTGDHFSLAGIGAGVDTLVGRFSTLGIVGMTIIHNLTNSALDMGRKIAGFVTDPLIEGGKRRALAIAQAKFQFEGLAMDIEATMKNANDAVSGTAYSLADAAMAASQLGASGMKAGDQMLSTLRAVAGVAAMTGREYSDIGNIFVSVAGNGRLMGGQLLQLSTSGVNAAATLAKSLGKTEAQVREMVSDGEISFKMFSDAMDNAFGKHAQAANKLYVGALANVKSAFGRIGADVAAQAFDNLRDILNVLRPVINEVHKALGPLIKDINTVGKVLTDSIITSLTNKSFEPLMQTLQAIQNVAKGLYGILVPIKQAFHEFFPAVTLTQLLVFTAGLRDLTAKFKMGEVQAANIKNTFRGVFAVLDIGRYIVVGITKALLSMVGPLLPVGDGLLHVTGAIGNFLVEVNKAIKSSTIFSGSLDKAASIISPVAIFIRDALLLLVDAFKVLTSSNPNEVDNFAERVSTRFSGLKKVIDFLYESLIMLVEFFKKSFPIFGQIASIVSEAVGQIGASILKAFNDGNFKAIFDLINGTLFAGILLGINKYVYSLTNIAAKGGFLQNIVSVFNGVRASLRLWQQELQAKILRSIAISIGILALSLVGISMIDSAKLTSSLAAIGGLLTELFLSMALFGKIANIAGMFGVVKVILALQGLAIAILILTFAMTKLAKLDWEGIAKGLTGVAGLCLILVATAKLLSKASGQMVTGSIGLISFAIALNLLADVVIKLGAIDLISLAKGLGSVGVLVLELAIFMRLTSGKGMGASSSLGLIALAYAILTLAKAVEAFASLSVNELIKGLGAVGVVLGLLAIFVRATGNAKNVIATAIGLTILAYGMTVLATAIETLGSIPLETLQRGLTAMGIALLTIAVAMNLMPPGMIFTATGLVIVASALLILSDALKSMGGMSWDEIVRGLTVLAGALTIIAIAMIFMTTSLAGAAALLIVSAALSVLAEVMRELGSMSLQQIGKSLLALAGVFVVLGLAALILTPLTPVLLALGVAVLLLGIGTLAVGAGLMLFAVGLTALSVALVASSGAILAFLTSIFGMLPLIISQLGIVLVAFAKVIILAAPAIGEAITAVLLAIITAVVTVIPKIINALMVLLESMLNALVKFLPMLVDAGIKLVMALLKGITDNIAKIVVAGADLIIKFLNGVTTKLPAIIQAAFKVIISFINGLANAIRDNSTLITEAVANLIDAIIGAILKLTYMFTDAGKNVIKGFIKGIGDSVGEAASAAANLAKSALAATKKALDIQSPSKAFAEVGKYSALGFAGGLKTYAGVVSDQAVEIGTKAVSALTGAVANISNLINGDMDIQPTIRPVLDLTDVNKGLRSTFDKHQSINVDDIRSKTATISDMDANRRSGLVQNGSKEPMIKTPSETNNGGILVQIENFVNNRAQDTQAWAEEFGFYMRQVEIARGGS